MYRGERENEIIQELKQCGYATVEHLAEKIHISPSSIRRDLADLERRGQVKRSYGGAELTDPVGKTIPFRFRSHKNVSLKRSIAKKAAELVQNGDTIFLDGSSSSFFLAEELTAVKGILVVTNSIDITSMLTQYRTRVICTGGIVSDDNRAVLVDDIAERTLRTIHSDLAFFSTQSLDTDGTVTDCYAREVRLRSVMIEQAARSVLLLDSTKLGRKSTFRQCHISDLSHIVCDKPLDRFFDTLPEHVQLLTAGHEIGRKRETDDLSD